MYKIVLSLAALSLTAGAAFAQTPTSFANVDANGNGELSFAELQVAWPDLSHNEFNAADIDGSGSLSSAELTTLQAMAAPMAPMTHAAPALDDTDIPQTLSGASTNAREIVD